MSETIAQETAAQAEEKAKIAKSKQEAIEAELKAAKAKKELDELNNPPDEKTVAETNKAIAEANKAIFDAKKAQLEGPDVTPPTGKFTGTGTFIESEILARKTLKTCFNSLVTEMSKQAIFKNKAITLVIYNAADFTAIELYSTLMEQVLGLEKQFRITNNTVIEKIKAGPYAGKLNPLLTGYAVSGVLKSAASIISLFKTTTDVTNSDIPLSEMTQISTLKEVLLASSDTNVKKWKIYIPASYPINTVKLPTAVNSPFIDALNRVNAEDQKATKNIQDIADDIKKQTDDLKSEEETLIKEGDKIQAGDVAAKAAHAKKMEELKKKKKWLTDYTNELNDMGEQLKVLADAFSKLQNLLSTADAATKITGQAVIMRAERLITFLNNTDVYVIKLAASSKGSNRITDNLWRSGRIEHSAGSTLDCIIFEPGGEVIFSNTQLQYTPYKKPDEINNN